jgi:hypothetical protein
MSRLIRYSNYRSTSEYYRIYTTKVIVVPRIIDKTKTGMSRVNNKGQDNNTTGSQEAMKMSM